MSTLVNPICEHCCGTGRLPIRPMPFVWKIIGQYVPTEWTPEAVKEFTVWAAERGLTWLAGNIEVRDPVMEKELAEMNPDFKNRTEGWHQDGMTYGGPIPENILMWCNKYPTEVRERKTANLVPNKEYDVLIVDNLRTVHRRQKLPQDDRWFIKIHNVILDERYFAGI